MSQIILNIHDESLKDKILWFLNSIKSEKLEIEEIHGIQNKEVYSEEYIRKNWRKIALSANSDDSYYKSDQYYEDRYEDYKQRGKI